MLIVEGGRGGIENQRLHWPKTKNYTKACVKKGQEMLNLATFFSQAQQKYSNLII